MLETFPVPTWPLWRLMQLLQARDEPDDLRERLERLESLHAARPAPVSAPARGGRDDATQLELLRARLEARLGQREQGRERARRAFAAARGARSRAAAATVCFALCTEAGHLAAALEHLRDAQAAAREAGDSPLLARLLFRQAGLFLCVNELDTAARCCEEILWIATQSVDPDVAASGENARAALGFRHARQARALARRGCADEAREERRLAAGLLPAITLASPLEAMHLVIQAHALLDDVAAARRAAATFLRRARWRDREPGWTAQLWLTLGLFYHYAGRAERGIVCYERGLAVARPVLRPDELADTLQLLADAHAAGARHDRALYWLRRSREIRRAAHAEQERVRLRVAARERDRDVRRREDETQRLHAQRLAVIGRLMAQIHHALRAPLAAAHDALTDCLRPDGEPSPQQWAARLREVEAHIDDAARLTRQLRMFSFRATPQIVALDLALSLREAWSVLAVGASGAAPCPPAPGATPPVRGDAQRLGVLLRILLIELQRVAGGAAPDVALAVRADGVCAVFGGRVVDAGGPPSVGRAFCEEIAREMQGRLCALDAPAGEFRLALELPLDA